MSTAPEHPDMPKQWTEGLVPTMNGKGFMFEVLDDYAQEFIEHAGTSGEPAIDVGCAYGIATIGALKRGAKVTACDMDQRHLEVLKSRTPKELHAQLTTMTGQLPDIDLPKQQFRSLLCSRVLHFLHGEDVEASVANFFSWLKPGGKMFLVADTPYGIWRNFIPIWEENERNGERWPGTMDNPVQYLPFEGSRGGVAPPMMNLLCPEQLQRTAEAAGFVVERCGFIDRSDFQGWGRMDGRENCGLVATKPY